MPGINNVLVLPSQSSITDMWSCRSGRRHGYLQLFYWLVRMKFLLSVMLILDGQMELLNVKVGVRLCKRAYEHITA